MLISAKISFAYKPNIIIVLDNFMHLSLSHMIVGLYGSTGSTVLIFLP